MAPGRGESSGGNELAYLALAGEALDAEAQVLHPDDIEGDVVARGGAGGLVAELRLVALLDGQEDHIAVGCGGSGSWSFSRNSLDWEVIILASERASERAIESILDPHSAGRRAQAGHTV